MSVKLAGGVSGVSGIFELNEAVSGFDGDVGDGSISSEEIF